MVLQPMCQAVFMAVSDMIRFKPMDHVTPSSQVGQTWRDQNQYSTTLKGTSYLETNSNPPAPSSSQSNLSLLATLLDMDRYGRYQPVTVRCSEKAALAKMKLHAGATRHQRFSFQYICFHESLDLLSDLKDSKLFILSSDLGSAISLWLKPAKIPDEILSFVGNRLIDSNHCCC